MGELPDLDESVLERLREIGGDEFPGELIGVFLEHAPKKIDEALAGKQNGDLEAVERAVHALKSSAGNIGANALMELAGCIEQLAGEKKGESIPPLLNELEEAFISRRWGFTLSGNLQRTPDYRQRGLMVGVISRW